MSGGGKFYGSPRWSGEIADCSLPVSFDTYSNCSFGCAYCFSQFQRSNGKCGESYLRKIVKPVNVERVKKIFTGEIESQFWPYIKDKRPIQWGGLSDQFDNYERKYGKTLELMEFFSDLNYPISFSTKSTWVFHDERYMRLFRKQGPNWNVKFSIITLNEHNAAVIEQGVDSPQKRLEAMRILSDAGCSATLRMRPFIIGVTSRDYLELIRAGKEHGASALSAEFMCVETRAMTHEGTKSNFDRISRIAGFDILKFYKENSSGAGYLRLNREIKAPYVQKMKALCDDIGLRLYISDAHFKECCNNSCCCGLNSEWKYSRGNFSYALQVAREKGEVRFSDIEGDMYFLNFKWASAENYNTSSVEKRARFRNYTMKDYLRFLWDTPKNPNSPMNAFGGILKPSGVDANGDVVYKFNPRVTV